MKNIWKIAAGVVLPLAFTGLTMLHPKGLNGLVEDVAQSFKDVRRALAEPSVLSAGWDAWSGLKSTLDKWEAGLQENVREHDRFMRCHGSSFLNQLNEQLNREDVVGPKGQDKDKRNECK